MFSDNYVYLCAMHNEHPTILAEKLGFSRAAGGKWANGAVPRKKTLHLIANYFNITVEELTGELQKKEPPIKRLTVDAKKITLMELYDLLDESGRAALLADAKSLASNRTPKDSH